MSFSKLISNKISELKQLGEKNNQSNNYMQLVAKAINFSERKLTSLKHGLFSDDLTIVLNKDEPVIITKDQVLKLPEVAPAQYPKITEVLKSHDPSLNVAVITQMLDTPFLPTGYDGDGDGANRDTPNSSNLAHKSFISWNSIDTAQKDIDHFCELFKFYSKRHDDFLYFENEGRNSMASLTFTDLDTPVRVDIVFETSKSLIYIVVEGIEQPVVVEPITIDSKLGINQLFNLAKNLVIGHKSDKVYASLNSVKEKMTVFQKEYTYAKTLNEFVKMFDEDYINNDPTFSLLSSRGIINDKDMEIKALNKYKSDLVYDEEKYTSIIISMIDHLHQAMVLTDINMSKDEVVSIVTQHLMRTGYKVVKEYNPTGNEWISTIIDTITSMENLLQGEGEFVFNEIDMKNGFVREKYSAENLLEIIKSVGLKDKEVVLYKDVVRGDSYYIYMSSVFQDENDVTRTTLYIIKNNKQQQTHDISEFDTVVINNKDVLLEKGIAWYKSMVADDRMIRPHYLSLA